MKKEIPMGDFRPHEKGLKKILGDLESEILEMVWEMEPVTVREIYENLTREKKLAYTTVMTVMSRLAKKGILGQEKKGNAYVYTSKWSREELLNYAVGKVMDGLLEDFEDVAVSKFVERIKEDVGEEDKLKELENKLLKRQKEEFNKGS